MCVEEGEGAGRRVQPAGGGGAARAWLEDEELERFMPETPAVHKLKHSGDSSKRPPSKPAGSGARRLPGPPPGMTKFQKRKERLIELLRPPYFILTVVIFMAAVHWAGGAALRAELEWAPGAWRAEPWRVLSYHLVHASAAHLALNALVAIVVGWCLEREQGWARAAAVWAGGAAAGALGAAALQPDVRVVGASAAVYAMLTAHIPNVCFRYGHVSLWWFRPLSVVVLCMSDLCWTLAGAGAGAGAGPLQPPPAVPRPPAALLFARWTQAHEPTITDCHVAWAAHAFGALMGVPIGFIVFKGENAGSRAVWACRAVSWLAAGGGALAALLWRLASALADPP